MILTNRLRRFSVMVAASAFAAVAFSAQAQEIAESHLKAAHAAISAIHATDSFDSILPQAAAALKQQLIQQNPDMQEVITQTVDEKTLALAARRADLEKESALAYAKAFSEQNLNDIAAFYNSEAGKKLIESGPIASRELVKAAEIWQNGIARDLAEQVGEKLKAVIGTKAPAEGAAPAEGTAPAAPAN
ncbi:DUF2059 domain-containing protein [Aminobacter aminovorans]|uniref:DUF2059 domain-containing protein n=1 Tax=Aminobacter aminovorans TaxID=83263 RepID=UPI00285E19CA|nr:DUF2059 domain-containing protein [Aminobacter aminovorans]MDR7220418.1 hypothetical protein [Aminobacter aminovorans]